jgi:hypothetical protein
MMVWRETPKCGHGHGTNATDSSEGLRVVGVACSGAEAADLAAELHPDVTLLESISVLRAVWRWRGS